MNLSIDISDIKKEMANDRRLHEKSAKGRHPWTICKNRFGSIVAYPTEHSLLSKNQFKEMIETTPKQTRMVATAVRKMEVANKEYKKLIEKIHTEVRG